MASFAIPHYLHIYDKPRAGSNWLNSYRADNYTHRLTARGGYDAASCSLKVRPSEAEHIFSNYLGNVVRIHVDDPNAPIFEGYIDRITYRPGGLVLTRSLENMANRVNVVYSETAGGTTQQTAVVNNAASQAIYGVKEMTIDGVVNYGADVTHKNALRNTILAIQAWPQISTASGSSGGETLELEIRGLQYMAWDWQNYRNTAAGTDNADLAIMRVALRTDVSAPTNAPYIYLTGSGGFTGAFTELIQANAAFVYSRQSEGGNTYLQYIQAVAEGGDGTNRWIYGITAPNPNTGIRRVYYRPMNAVVSYQANALLDTGRLRDTSGAIVPGWLVTPDAGIQIMDVLVGYNQSGDDPRIGYIESIDYDGETGLVSFQTGDNITMEGILQKDRYYKPQNAVRRFGAAPRTKL